MERCKASRKNGKPCTAYARTDSKFCFMHDPAGGKARAQARKRGGENRRRVKNLTPFPVGIDTKTARGLLELTSSVIEETWALESSNARSRTLGYLVGIQKTILEVGEIEARLEAVENAVKNGGMGK